MTRTAKKTVRTISYQAPIADWLELFKRIAPAASRDETRSHLCGIHFNGFEIVATDGHRLHLCDGLLQPPSGDARPFTLPIWVVDAIQALVKIRIGRGEIISVEYDGDHITVTMGDTSIITRRVEANEHFVFPPYEQIIPHREDYFASATFQLKELRLVTNKARKEFGTDAKLALGISQTLAITAQKTEEGQEPVCFLVSSSAKFTDEKPPPDVGLQLDYFKDAIRGCGKGGDVTIHFGREDLTPLVVEGSQFKAVIMPMRLR